MSTGGSTRQIHSNKIPLVARYAGCEGLSFYMVLQAVNVNGIWT